MSTSPRICVLVPVPPGSQPADATVASVRGQGYAPVDVIVREAAHHRAALDACLAEARGDVFACVRPGETLLPGALGEAAAALASDTPAVMGRSAWRMDAMGGDFIGHPSEYRGLFDHLAVWKGRWDRAARPSLFWRASLQRTPMRLSGESPEAVDYDLVCHIGSRAAIRTVDSLWSVRDYVAPLVSEPEALQELLSVSRLHWGSWARPLRWRCELSSRLDAKAWRDRARHHARRAEEAAMRGDVALARLERLKAALISPRLGRERFGAAYRRSLEAKSR